MFVKLLSKLPTSALIRILLAERKLMSAAATHFKNRANKKALEYRASYTVHLITVELYKDQNIQKPIEKPKFVEEIEAYLENAKRYEDWVRTIDATLWSLEVSATHNAK